MEREQATKFMYDLLRALTSRRGSDLFLTSGFPPAMKIDGKMTPVSQQVLTGGHTAMLIRSIMNDRQAAEFGGALRIVPSPRHDSLRSPFFQRGIVEKRVGPRRQCFERERRGLGKVAGNHPHGARLQSTQQPLQSLNVHCLVQAVGNGLIG